jgi:hypothetical protein
MNRTLAALEQLERRAPGAVRLLGSGVNARLLRLDPRGRPHSTQSLRFLSSLRPTIVVGEGSSAKRLHAVIEQQLFGLSERYALGWDDPAASGPRLSRSLSLSLSLSLSPFLTFSLRNTLWLPDSVTLTLSLSVCIGRWAALPRQQRCPRLGLSVGLQSGAALMSSRCVAPVPPPVLIFVAHCFLLLCARDWHRPCVSQALVREFLENLGDSGNPCRRWP